MICSQESWKELKLLAHLSLAPRAGGKIADCLEFYREGKSAKERRIIKGRGASNFRGSIFFLWNKSAFLLM